MLANLIVLMILGIVDDWRPDACDRTFANEDNQAWCEGQRDDGAEWAGKLGTIISSESERTGIPAEWIVGVIAQESGFARGNVCPIQIDADRLVSRAVLDEESGREKMCWTYQSAFGEKKNCQPVLVLEETDEYLLLDRCAYGEMGLMQVRPHEARAGQVVPATGEPLPQSRRERHSLMLDPQINISLGVEALVKAREFCCGEDQDCWADPENWIGAYNSGYCDNERYVRNLQRKMDEGIEYACSVDSSQDVCSAEE